jgi:proline iminopeptidase
MVKKYATTFLFLLLTLFGCNEPSGNTRQEGFISVPGGKIWYEIVGSEKKGIPIVLLHGGPGFSVDYLRPLAALSDERPVIFYDQLGSGKSDKPTDTALWKIERFVDELIAIRKHLRLDTIHLFGHSWGTMLASEYLSRNPEGIKTVIFASPCITTQKWLADANTLRSQLPQAIQDTLSMHEARGTTNAPGYLKATEEFYRKFLSRKPYSPEVKTSLDNLNMEVYKTMWGNNEFTSTGNLRTFDRSDELRKITVPTLFTCGEFDEATPGTTAWYATKVKNAELKIIKDAAHMTMNEQPKEYVKVVRTFLAANE